MTAPHALRTRRRRLCAGLALLAMTVGAVASCGISPQDEAARIEPADVPFGLLEAEPTTTDVPQGRDAQVYLLAADRLIAVDRSVATDVGLVDLLELVIAGPTEVERSLGITSAVPAGTVATVDESRGVAQVDLTAAFGDVRSGEQLLALGQIVYTLTGQPGIGAVQFSLEGEDVQVPLANGALSDDPLSRDDFEALAPA